MGLSASADRRLRMVRLRHQTPPPSHRAGLIDCRTDEPLPENAAIVKKWNAWMEQQYAKLYLGKLGNPNS